MHSGSLSDTLNNMAKNVLITGINGFVGRHLTRYLSSTGNNIFGIGLYEPVHNSINNLVTAYYACDLTDTNAVSSLPLANIDAVIN